MGKLSIEQLENLLNSEEETPIQILPNGEVAPLSQTGSTPAGRKPLTMKEDLGGEYTNGN